VKSLLLAEVEERHSLRWPACSSSSQGCAWVRRQM
jgi:hypothetical protein